MTTTQSVLRLAGCCLCAILLAACGGGGVAGDPAPAGPAAPPAAEAVPAAVADPGPSPSAPAAPIASGPPPARFSRLIVAGDSLADVGTFGFKFTVQDAANRAGFPIFPELVGAAHGLPGGC